MKEIKIKSVIPIYMVGLAWLLYSFIFPLYEFYHLLIAAAVSSAVYIVSSKLIPKRTIMVKEEIDKTGISQIDSLITKGEQYISELEKLNDDIKNVKISEDIVKITSTSKRMLGFVSKNPEISGQLKTFMDYYYPTIIKLLNSYSELTSQPPAGDNIIGSISQIEGIMDTIVNAYNKQLDNMYSDKALDISTDIDVLKNILASEDLGSQETGSL